MTLAELSTELGAHTWPLAGVAIGVPVLLWAVGRFVPGARESRPYGHVASALVALAIVVLTLATLVIVYSERRGTDLVSGLPISAYLLPGTFGFGTIIAATRVVPFAELRRYPLLRRVYASLLAAVVAFVALVILKQTVLVVFSGLIGAAILAIVIWTLFQKLVRRAVGSHDGDDGDLLDDAAATSHRRAARFAQRVVKPPEDRD